MNAGNFAPDVGGLARLEIKRFNFPQAGYVVSTERLADGFIDVQPVVSKLGNDLDQADYPILRDVPVIYPSTALTSFQFPVSQGDGVLLFFTQHDSSAYVNGRKTVHLPNMFSFLGLHHAVAIVGFNPFQESPHNPNNYSGELNPESLNIVHNKKTEREVRLSFNTDGSLDIVATGTVNVKCKDVVAECETIDATNALIKTQNDVEIQGLSVYKHMTQHDHNYTDDGNPTVTAKPNNK